MEVLKVSLMVFVLWLPSTFLAQNYETLQSAFKKSYELEYQGKYSDAINVLKKVYDENSYEINLRLGWLFYMNGNFSESIPYYQQCINIKPFSIEAKLGYVNPASAMGEWQKVENQYNEILKIAPNNTLVNYRLGMIFFGRKDYQSAKRYFEKVVNLFPFDYDSVIMLAWSDYYLKKYREASVLFQKALLIKPDDASALEGLHLLK